MKRAWTRQAAAPILRVWPGFLLATAALLPACGPADLPVEDAHDVVAASPPPPGYYLPPAPPTIIVVQCPAMGSPACAVTLPETVPVGLPPPLLAAPPAIVPRIAAAPPAMDPRIQAVVRSHDAKFRRCYEKGLRRNPVLRGRVVVRLVIDPDGEVDSVRDHGSTLYDEGVMECILEEYEDLEFPRSSGMTVVYPLEFAPRG